MYQVNICTIVSFHCVEIIVLLFTRIRDHCCVLCDVTLDCFSLDISGTAQREGLGGFSPPTFLQE